MLISWCFLGCQDRQEASRHTVPDWQKAHMHPATLPSLPHLPTCLFYLQVFCWSNEAAWAGSAAPSLFTQHPAWGRAELLLAEEPQKGWDPFAARMCTQVCGIVWGHVLLGTGPKIPKERDWVPFPTSFQCQQFLGRSPAHAAQPQARAGR